MAEIGDINRNFNTQLMTEAKLRKLTEAPSNLNFGDKLKKTLTTDALNGQNNKEHLLRNYYTSQLISSINQVPKIESP
jgi:hypothetical protein